MVKIKNALVGVAAGAVAIASLIGMSSTAYAASLTNAQVQAIVSLLASFGADSATIANVNSALTGTPVVVVAEPKFGDRGPAVVAFQKDLIAHGYKIPAGATGYYGAQTKAAVAARDAAKGSTTTTVTGTTLKVSVAQTSPNGSVLVAGQAIGDLGDFTFTNTSATPVNVTSLVFKRSGVSNDSTLDNVYLYNGVNRLTDSAGVSNSQFTFSDPVAVFTVPANGTYTVSVRADISSATGTSGQQVGVSLVTVSQNGTLDSSVVFPLNSGFQTISGAQLAGVTFNDPTPTGTPSISPQTMYTVWQASVSADQNPVSLRSIKFTNLGSVDASAVTNLKLFVDGSQVGSTVAQLGSDRTVLFDLSANPALLSTQSHTVKVVADVVGGASRTIQFSVQRSADVMFVDSQLNQPIRPTFGARSTGVITINSVKDGNGVSVSVDPASPNQDVAINSTNVKLASFDFLASGEAVKVSDLYVFASTTLSSGSSLSNGKILVNGSQVGSTKAIGLTGSPTDFALGSSLILPAGVTTHVDIYADTKNVTSPITINLKQAVANAQGQSSLNSVNVPSQTTPAYAVTTSLTKLTASKYSGVGDQNIVPGSTARIGSFTLSTGATEGVTVDTITVVLSAANAATSTNLSLRDYLTGATIGQVITTPSESNSVSVNIDIPSSTTRVIDIFVTTLASANNGPIKAKVSASGRGDLTGSPVPAQTPVELQTTTVGTGSLSIARGASNPFSANIVAGTNVSVGQFNFTAQSSAYTVQNLDIQVNGNAPVSNVTLSYKNSSGATQTANQVVDGSLAKFTGLNLYVPANESNGSNLEVFVAVPETIAVGNSLSGATTSVAVVNTDFRASNSAGATGATIDPVTNSNAVFTVRKSLPTFAALPASVSIPSSGIALYRFSVTADPKGAVNLDKVTFNIATTSTSITGMYLVDEDSGQQLSTASDSPAITLTNTQQIAAGATKTYDLYGIVNGFPQGASLTISLASDSVSTNNTAWSDKAATGSINGYLLKNFTTNSVSYSR